MLKPAPRLAFNACHDASKVTYRIELANRPGDMDAPGNNLHPLKAELIGHWSVRVNGNWRLTFSFEGEDVILVDYQDYH